MTDPTPNPLDQADDALDDALEADMRRLAADAATRSAAIRQQWDTATAGMDPADRAELRRLFELADTHALDTRDNLRHHQDRHHD